MTSASSSVPPAGTRAEQDLLGTCNVPNSQLYGIHTQRALENFPSTGRPLGGESALLHALVQIKRAAAIANGRTGVIDPSRVDAIAAAADAVLAGRHREHFPVDLMEGSGGTSLNMNVNEVLANVALASLNQQVGDYSALHPNDHVNRSQSTNDVLPSAILMAMHEELETLRRELEGLQHALELKATDFRDILRLGRTCLQDAQPMTLGQAFGSYAAVVERAGRALASRQQDCLSLPLGATAIGTGFGAPEGYRSFAFEALRAHTGVAWTPNRNMFDGLANADGYARLSGELRTAAGALAKIASDLMLLASGPHGGIAELRLPELQAGSSIMPGKVNPVVPLSVCQVAFAVTGCDVAIACACQQGQLEINPFEPLIAAQLLQAIRMLRNAVWQLRTRCVAGIEPDVARMTAHLQNSTALATALVPTLGYANVTAFVRRAQAEGVSFLDLLGREGVLSSTEAELVLRNCTAAMSVSG